MNIVRCEECIYWRDWHVLEQDGTRRPYKKNEIDSVTGLRSVPTSVGANVSPQCFYDYLFSEGIVQPVFRNENDFCSKGKK